MNDTCGTMRKQCELLTYCLDIIVKLNIGFLKCIHNLGWIVYDLNVNILVNSSLLTGQPCYLSSNIWAAYAETNIPLWLLKLFPWIHSYFFFIMRPHTMF